MGLTCPRSSSSRTGGSRAGGKVLQAHSSGVFPSQISAHLRAWLPSQRSSLHPKFTSPPSPLDQRERRKDGGLGQAGEAPLAGKKRKIY